MRTSQEIFYQIRWDPRFVASQYSLGVATREGRLKEVPLAGFEPGGDVPWHRIRYIRGPQGICWDRSRGLDVLAPPESATVSCDLPSPFRVRVWNVSLGRHGVASSLAEIARQLGEADILALLECRDELLSQLPGRVYQAGEVALVTRVAPLHWESFWLSQDKPALLADFGSFRLVVAHFTSNFRGCAASRRNEQWGVLQEHLGDGNWLVLGDLNASDAEVKAWGRDLTPEGPSFDPERNPLTRPGMAARYQRVLSAGPWEIVQSRVDLQAMGSDHFPLELSLRLGQLSRDSAWALIPPRRLWPQIQAIRENHDPAFESWPPHLNLLYPAPLQPDYDSLSQLLAQQERFHVRLSGLGRFEHSRNQTLYWRHQLPQLDSLRSLLGASDDEYCPHLTLAKGRHLPTEVNVEESEFEAMALVHLRRLEGKMRVQQVLPLAPPDPDYRALCRRCQGVPVMVGSRLWGVLGDLDVVLMGPPPAGSGRQVGAVWRETNLDVILDDWQAVLDRNALWTQVEDPESFAGRMRRWWQWLERRCLPGQAWGLPGGLAWASLLLEHDDSALLEGGWDEVRAPALPRRDLLETMPPEAWRLLRQELALGIDAQKYQVNGLRLLGQAQGRGLGLWLDLERKLGIRVRPWRDSEGYGLAPEGPLERVESWIRQHYPDWAFSRTCLDA